MLYIQRNEHRKELKVLTETKNGTEITAQFRNDINVIDREYPEIKIDFIELNEEYFSELISIISRN